MVVLLVVLSACIDPGIQSELDEVKSQVTVLQAQLKEQRDYVVGFQSRIYRLETSITSITSTATSFGAPSLAKQVEEMSARIEALKNCVDYLARRDAVGDSVILIGSSYC